MSDIIKFTPKEKEKELVLPRRETSIDPFAQLKPGESFLEFLDREKLEAQEQQSTLQNSIKWKHENANHHKREIIALYNSYKPVNQIAPRFGVSPPFIVAILKEWGVPERRKTHLKSFIIDDHKSEIIRMYTKELLPTAEIGRKIGKYIAPRAIVGEAAIRNRLHRWGIPIRTSKKLDESKAIELLGQGMRVEDVAFKLGVSSPVIERARVKHFGRKRDARKIIFGNSAHNIVRKAYSRGMAVEQIFQILKSKGLVPKATTQEPIYSYIKYNYFKRYPLHITDQEFVKITGMIKSETPVDVISLDLWIPKDKIRVLLKKHTKIIYPRFDDIPNRNKAIASIRHLRSIGFGYIELSYVLGISEKVITGIIRRYDLPRYKVYKYDDAELAPKIRELRLKKYSTAFISKKLGISISAVQGIAKKHHIPAPNKVFDEEMSAKVKELYKANVHPTEIARRLGLNQGSLQEELRRTGLLSLNKPWNINHHKYSPEETQHQNDIIRKYYSPPLNKSIFALSKALHIDKTTIRDRLLKMGIKLRTDVQAKKLRRETKHTPIHIHPELEFVVKRRAFAMRSHDVKAKIERFEERNAIPEYRKKEHFKKWHTKFIETRAEKLLKEQAKKVALKQKQQLLYEMNREKNRLKSKQYYEAHKAKITERSKAYAKTRKGKHRLKEYYIANREKLLERAKQRYKANPEAHLNRAKKRYEEKQREKARIKAAEEREHQRKQVEKLSMEERMTLKYANQRAYREKQEAKRKALARRKAMKQ